MSKANNAPNIDQNLNLSPQKKLNAAVLVLGDLNRSPRMLNHAKAISESLPDRIDEISLIGYNGGDIRSDIKMNNSIRQYYIPELFKKFFNKLPRVFFPVVALIKVFLQIFMLFYILLFKIPKPDFLILQNPPGIPTIFICSIVCFIRRSKFIIDWHNYGYTILQVNRRSKFMCLIAKFYEVLFAKASHLNFCVSESMRINLKDNMGIDAIVLHDRALKGVFKKLDVSESHEVFQKYEETRDLFTELNPITNLPQYKPEKPILMVSSTSWTPDEDFGLLLNSIEKIDTELTKFQRESKELNKKIRKILFLITGRGPQKDFYMNKIKQTNLKYFTIRSIWLESDDYPKILGAADLGVCLHYSSSGFDLPMKVVDMFAAQLPVCAVYYPTITELVEENKNGFLFKNEDELAELLTRIIKDFSVLEAEKDNDIKIQSSPFVEHKKLKEFSENLKQFAQYDWVSQWDEKVKPQLLTLIDRNEKMINEKKNI